jgi:hypothetical protein
MKGNAQSRYQKHLDANGHLVYCRPDELEKFLKHAVAEHPGRVDIAHPNCSDEGILSLAFEIERVGVDPANLHTQLDKMSRRPARLIMEVIGVARTNAACDKLLKVVPVQVINGRTRVSPLAPVTPKRSSRCMCHTKRSSSSDRRGMVPAVCLELAVHVPCQTIAVD